jgi:hypothetical protein
MSTVKISQLPPLPSIAANTSNTLFLGVDIPSGTTGKFTATTLAQQLYANNVLIVGNYDHSYPNAVGTFVGTSNNYVQTILENTLDAGTSDIVAQSNVSTDTKYFSTMGFAGADFDNINAYNSLGTSLDKLDGYLYVQGDTTAGPGGNLVIGTATSGKVVRFIAGGGNKANIVMTLNSTGPSINSGAQLTFGDGSTQSVAAAPANYTQSAFDAANTAAGNTAVIQGVNLTQNNNITYVNQYAASAYAQANTNATSIVEVNQYANSAYTQANTNATNITLVNQYANTAYAKANSALANATGLLAGDLTIAGNLISLGSTTTQGTLTSGNNVTLGTTRIRYATINDNTPLLQLVAAGNNFSFMQPTNPNYMIHVQGRDGITSRVVNDAAGNNITSSYVMRTARGSANTPTNVIAGDVFGRISTVGYATTGFSTASDARIDFAALENFSDTNKGTAISVWTTQNTTNNLIRTASFSVGNTGIFSANTYVAGDLTVTGNVTVFGTANTAVGNINVNKNVTVNGTMILANSNFLATESAMLISATPTVAVPANDGYMLHISGKEGVPSRIVYDSYGSGAYAVVAGRTARGTVASPTAVANNDVLMRVSGNGHGGGANGWTSLGVARMDIVATENYNATNRGSQIQFWNCPIGSNTLQKIATFNGDAVEFTGVVSPQKGFILTPNVISANVTTETIDFSRDCLKKHNIVADCTITLQNFVAGKVVEMWITNLSGSNRAVTHGVSALNSTNNGTTVTIPSTSSAYFKYFSIDGDAANTFLSVVHA